MTRRFRTRMPLTRVAALLAVLLAFIALPAAALAAPNTASPATVTKYVFVHHSTGDAWLQDGYGGLAHSLSNNNYFVSDTNYGWGPDGIGNSTDIGHWWTWFRGPSASTYTAALYANTGINSSYARALANPGGENEVIMFKSCFPNSAVGGAPTDAVPPIGSNSLKGNSGPLTVGNAKGIYLDLLPYFAIRPDKMFVVIVSPPLVSGETNATQANNARYLANWLVDPEGYLKGYSAGNVFVYDYYTVLTGGHHRVIGGAVEHSAGATNYLVYPTSSGDSHPTAAGDQIATAEFVPMLNAAYNAWKAGGSAMVTSTVTPTVTPRATTLSKPSAGKTRLSRKRTYTWRGGVSPSQIGTSLARVEVQRKVGRKWRGAGTYSAQIGDGTAAWALKLRVKRAGSYRIRVKHADGDHAGATSAYRAFSVR